MSSPPPDDFAEAPQTPLAAPAAGTVVSTKPPAAIRRQPRKPARPAKKRKPAKGGKKKGSAAKKRPAAKRAGTKKGTKGGRKKR